MSYAHGWRFRGIVWLMLVVFHIQTINPMLLGYGSPHGFFIRQHETNTASIWERLLDLVVPPAQAQAVDPLLESAPEFDLSDPFLVEKANQLGRDPAQIFAFVRDEIGFESYKGSLRGARGTLWSKAGNTLDKASLLIALLRVSNIPARYAQGTLLDNLAQQLILSMFPAPLRVVGCLNPGTEVSDPANDPKLLEEAREHYWVEFDAGNGLQAADPNFENAQIGQAFTAAQGTFNEVPDNLRHKVTVRLKRELTIPAVGLFTGGASQDVATVLEETFNTAGLVGKPLSVGHFVNRSPIGTPLFTSITNTYSPYIAVGDFAAPIREDKLIRGMDYQEAITNFPFGNQILTGLFLEMEVRGPDGPTETFERTLVDLIGFDVRTNGGSPNLTFDPNGPLTLTDSDVFTVNILPGKFDPNAAAPLSQEITDLQQALGNVEDDGVFTPQETSILRQLTIGQTHASGASFFHFSDLFTSRFGEVGLVRPYFDRPRIAITSNRILPTGGNASSAQFSNQIDLRRDTIRVIVFPNQNVDAARSFRIARGIADNVVETEVAAFQASGAPGQALVVSTQRVFEEARAAGIGLLPIAKENHVLLDAVPVSAEAKTRITGAVVLGKIVIVPERSVTIGGVERIAWYEIDPETGETTGVTEDGGHQALVEYSAQQLINASINIGILIGFARYLIKLNNCLRDGVNLKDCKKKMFDDLKGGSLAGAIAGLFLRFGVWHDLIGAAVGLGDAAGGAASLLGGSLVVDPPLTNSLLSPLPSDEFANLSGSGVVAKIIADSLFTLPFSGAQLPTVFRIGIKNTETATDTFSLNFANVPTGFTAQTSVPQITIPPGETAEIGICLRPTSGLPALGTPASFTLDVSGSTASTSDTESFTVPEIHGVTLTSTPAALNTTPGAPVPATLTLTSVGNVPEIVDLSSILPPGLSLDGLGPVNLGIGETEILPLTLIPAANTPLNSTLTAQVNASFGALEPQTLQIPVRVVVPGADAVGDAAVAAAQLGKADLANRLNDLSIALTNLVQDQCTDVSKGQVLASLDSIISLLANDPELVSFVDELTAVRNAIAATTTSAECLASVTDLGSALDDFATVVTDQARNGFEAFLLPTSQVAQPQTAANFELRLHNTGADPTTYDVSLAGLPASVSGQVIPASVTLDRDEFGSVQITLSQTSTTELAAFNFEAVVTPQEAPGIERRVPGALSVRQDLVSVVSVTPNPAFTDPGGQVNVSARLLNAVNQEQDARVFYVVRDPQGQIVFTSQAVPTQLTVMTSLTTVDLGALDTTGFALGTHAIAVTVEDLNSDPIPGATGQGSLLVGSPVTASIAVNPETLPPGAGTVTNTLQIDTPASFNAPFTLIGQSAIAGARNAVRHPDPNVSLVYVCGASGISLFDINNPAQPQLLTTVGSPAFVCRIRNNQLIAMRGFPNVVVAVYSLADPLNPQLLGSTPDIPYTFGVDLSVTDTHAFVTIFSVAFFLAGNDIFAQTGDVLSIDISDPSAPQLVDVLLNTNGTNNDGVTVVAGLDLSGGNFNMWQVAQPDAQTLLVASTTSTGGDTQTGTGIVRILDISDPAALTEVGTLPIPGTVQVMGLARQGNQALVMASSGGWQDFFNNNTNGFSGNIVLATLDISNPRNPQLIATQMLNRGSRNNNEAIAYGAIALGNGKYAFGSQGLAGDQPQLHLVDGSDPDNLIVSAIDVPANIGFTMAAAGNLLFTTSSAGLLIYDIGESAGIPVTAQVQIPKNTGVAVIPNSFNVLPTQTIPGADFDTLVWETTLASGNQSRSFTWQSGLNNLQPGEAREVTLGTDIDFFVQGTAGQITLPPTVVASQQILAIDPSTRTVAPGAPAGYNLSVKNPTAGPVTYTLSVQGVPAGWVNLAPSVNVPAQGSVDMPLTLTADPFTPQGQNDFVVTASAGGTLGSVLASLILQGAPVLPAPDPEARGVVLSLAPAQATAGQGTAANFVLRVTNTGSGIDTFDLSVAEPAGLTAVLAAQSVTVPPGAGSFREVAFSLTPAPGTAAGTQPFQVTASSTTKSSVMDTAQGSVQVVGQGVAVTLNPASGTPVTTYQLRVTNTGQIQDTFDLATAGPAGLVASLGSNAVTLNAGGSQAVNVTLGALDFAFPGSLDLIGTATSRANAAVRDSATAQVLIPASKGITASFDPATVTLAQPGAGNFLLRVQNTGNSEDAYAATITGTSGPVTASLNGLDGQPAQSIPTFRLPGLATGALVLTANLAALGTGTVTVTVVSQSDPGIRRAAVATLQTAGPVVAEQIPALSSTALVLLAAMLLLGGAIGLRRRRR